MTTSIQVINKSQWELPKYETLYSAGMDVRGDFSRIKVEKTKPVGLFFDTDATLISEGKIKQLEIKSGGRCLIPTGLFVAIPQGYELQVRPRSGNAIKVGVTVLNSPGTVDADYRGEIGIILINASNTAVRFKDGDRIAQLVLAKHETAEWIEVKELDETDRGESGFGHTGK